MPRSYPHVAQLRNGNARAGGCSTLAAATWLGTQLPSVDEFLPNNGQPFHNPVREGLPTTRSASSELLRGVAIATNLFTQSESLRVAFHSDEFLQVYH